MLPCLQATVIPVAPEIDWNEDPPAPTTGALISAGVYRLGAVSATCVSVHQPLCCCLLQLPLGALAVLEQAQGTTQPRLLPLLLL
jgi:hypothetical protein